MPKIKKIFPTFGDKQIELEIWYNTKNLFHIKGGLPLWVLEVLGDQIITERYDSPDQLDLAVRDFAAMYTEAIRTKKKVIIYNIGFGSSIIDAMNLEGSKYNGTLGNRVAGYGFSFKYRLCMMHVIGGKKTYNEFVPEFYGSDNMVESHRSTRVEHDESVIEWTEDREKFFKDLKESTHKLCSRIRDFFGTDEKSQLKAIDSGIKLLNQ